MIQDFVVPSRQSSKSSAYSPAVLEDLGLHPLYTDEQMHKEQVAVITALAQAYDASPDRETCEIAAPKTQNADGGATRRHSISEMAEKLDQRHAPTMRTWTGLSSFAFSKAPSKVSTRR